MCMIDGADETFTVYRSPERRRSRKDRTCAECRRSIAAGEHYWSAAGLYDGHWETHYCCEHCHVACEWLEQNCGGFMFHSVYEDISEHVWEYRGSARCVPRLQRLRVSMRRKWLITRGPHAGKLMAIPAVPAKLEPPAPPPPAPQSFGGMPLEGP